MSLLVLLATVPLSPILDKLPKGEQSPPKAFAEGGRLPGKPAPELKNALGSWQMDYSLEDVDLASGNSDLIVNLTLKLNEDGSYQMVYAARWGRPPGKGKNAAGVNVDETGTYKLSGDVLILESNETMLAEVVKTKAGHREPIKPEKHVFVMHWETKRIHLVGRCAGYQVDPICQNPDAPNVWFTLKGSGAKRLFGG